MIVNLVLNTNYFHFNFFTAPFYNKRDGSSSRQISTSFSSKIFPSVKFPSMQIHNIAPTTTTAPIVPSFFRSFHHDTNFLRERATTHWSLVHLRCCRYLSSIPEITEANGRRGWITSNFLHWDGRAWNEN